MVILITCGRVFGPDNIDVEVSGPSGRTIGAEVN